MRKYSFWIIIFLFTTVACNKEEVDVAGLYSVSGYVQKGPYLNGTNVTLYELSDELAPTGKSFTSQIYDNRGTFNFDVLELQSQYAELMANGFYFNETDNINSPAQLTLFAITDLTNKSALNVNVLSHLERRRVKHLLAEGMEFKEAKKQAQMEILRIFEIEKTDIPESEILDISMPGDDNGILLALSVILQGHLPVAGLSELLANIGYDIMEDGNLTYDELGVALINNANILKLEEIRTNLTNRYRALGMDVNVPDFEKYVQQFVENTGYVATNIITYPSVYNSEVNLLADSSFVIKTGFYAMAAYMPLGRSLKVVCKPTEGTDWGMARFHVGDEGLELENHYPDSMILTATGADQIVNARMLIEYTPYNIPTSFELYIYENGSQSFTRHKTMRSF